MVGGGGEGKGAPVQLSDAKGVSYFFKICFNLCVCVSECHVCGCAHRSQRRVCDCLELELQAAVRHLMLVLGPEPWSQVST